MSASFCELCRLVKKGCFGSLEELHTSVRYESELVDVIDFRFPFLRKLYINCNGRDQKDTRIISKRVQDMISKGIFPSLETCIVCTGEITCNHGTRRQQSNDDDEETVIETCPGYSIPSMMYLRPRRNHQEDTCAITSPSEAIETSQFSGNIFLFFYHLQQIKIKRNKVAQFTILSETCDFS